MFNKVLVIGILLVGATFSVSANEVQKWEYSCFFQEPLASEITQQFDQMGEHGWELVSITTVQELIFACFKLKKS